MFTRQHEWIMSAVDIEGLKRVLGAHTELELAAKLGIARSTVSQWRRRGSIPGRYQTLLHADLASSDAAVAGQQVFRRPEAQYWLRSALALLPEGRDSEGLLAAGHSREKLVIALMGLAIRVARTDLRRQAIRNDAEWAQLMGCLVSGHRDVVIAILSDHGASPSPDVLNGVLNRGD
jgi:transcriptional regulator with XRE-family HTH domain